MLVLACSSEPQKDSGVADLSSTAAEVTFCTIKKKKTVAAKERT